MFPCRRWVLVLSTQAMHMQQWAASAQLAWSLAAVSLAPWSTDCTALAFLGGQLVLPGSGLNSGWVQTTRYQPSSAAFNSLRTSAYVLKSCWCVSYVWPWNLDIAMGEGVCMRAEVWQPLLHSTEPGGEPHRPATQTNGAGLLKELQRVCS